MLIVVLDAGGQFDAMSSWFESIIGPKLFRELTFSKFVVADYLLAVLVFCSFGGMRRVAGEMARFFDHIDGPVNWLARHTFLFWGSVRRSSPAGPRSRLAVTALTLRSVLVVGQLTEYRRPALRRWMLNKLSRSRPVNSHG